mmetsp:Transcript_4634/g.10180  ORF Transcript_4634/g.10180 Transcript_4634/m.10180 type:complete len:621 (-) Transcript_4634:85-1947(-)
MEPRNSPLPLLSTFPKGTYPPSSYPPPSYFESTSVIYPALLIPAKRTGEIQKALGPELTFQERKRKRVYPLEEGLDYTKDDLEHGDGRYDARKERKLVLARLGPADSAPVSDAVSDTENGKESNSEELDQAMKDKVWLDPRVKSLLAEAANDSNNSITAPNGKCSVRPSYIQLPATPYSLLTVDQVLRRIMPTEDNTSTTTSNNNNDNNNNNSDTPVPIEEIPSSFEIAGHIAHLNLRSESLPYKYLIGKAILDKNRPKIRMVVNKTGTIENEFRTFPMEMLAGDGLDLDLVERLCAGDEKGGEGSKENNENNGCGSTILKSSPPQRVQVDIGPEHQSLMLVEVKEHGCRFKLDFARVYFNSRLQSEHARLVQEIVRGATESDAEECIVADAMAGVGPFAVPLTSANAPHFHKTRIVCHANDLNPVSYRYLQGNAKGNRCFSDRLVVYNLDAREFIRRMNEQGVEADHFIMNLPQLAPEFLDAFRGWKFRGEEKKRPLVHVHCFGEKARNADEFVRVERQAQQRCEKALGSPGCLSDSKASDNDFGVRVVRDVGPRKNMLCVSFRLPREVGGVEKIELNVGSSDCGADGNANGGKRDRTKDEGGASTDGTDSHPSKRIKE